MSVAAAQWDEARSLRLAARLRAAEPRTEALGHCSCSVAVKGLVTRSPARKTPPVG